MKKFRAHLGDVQAIRIETLPVGAVRVEPDQVKPIALGEKSGHMHVVTGDIIDNYVMLNEKCIKKIGGDG